MIRRRLKCNSCGSKFTSESYIPRILEEDSYCIKCRRSKRKERAERLLKAIFRDSQAVWLQLKGHFYG